MTPRILVAGVGNVFLGDDAFGCEVAARLIDEGMPPGVDVEDFGIRSFDLASALASGYDAAILVDAMPRGDPPGTISVIEPGDDTTAGPPVVDGHSLDPVQVLGLADTLGGRPGQLVVVGVEPASVELDEDGAMGLSPAVAGAVDRAVEVIRDQIDRLAAIDDGGTTDDERLDERGDAAPGLHHGNRAGGIHAGGRLAVRPVTAGGAALPEDEADVVGAGAADA